MRMIKLRLGQGRTYNIIVGSNILSTLAKFIKTLNLGSAAYIITNAAIKHRYGASLKRALEGAGISIRFKTIPDTEKSKSIRVSGQVIQGLAHYDQARRIFIVAFGGGVVGDLAGFVASIYKRGIPYIQIPTTLLAQVDSAIGGKTAVDLSEGKNLVGAIYQPRLVFSEIKFLNSLDPRQMRCGLAEVIKYGIIKDRQLFGYLERRYKDILQRETPALEFIINRCSEIKARVTSLDEREKKGLRTILNFGHTTGHAIEAATDYKRYNHGEAIALGMLVAADISRALGLVDQKVLERIEVLVKSTGLPVRIKGVTLAGIINAHYRDKKFIGSKNRFVLITDIGRTKIAENVPLSVIKEAIKRRF